jgi:hypothetical protein
MTRQSQKLRERFFAEQAIKSLGKDWIIRPEERENPDFIVADGEHVFGLEVAAVFAGKEDDTGSLMKKNESGVQRSINALRTKYEASARANLHVRFVGRIDPATVANVVPNLIALDLESKTAGFRTVLDEKLGLRVHITKAFRSDWYSVNDRVGWVDRSPEQIIARAISDKSDNLPRYKSSVGDDIRLLLVADAIQNSGKLRLAPESRFDLRGFRGVYFFHYPEVAVALRGKP